MRVPSPPNKKEEHQEPFSLPVGYKDEYDLKNRQAGQSNPQGGIGEIPKERLHLDQVQGDIDRTYEPKPAGKHDSAGHPFKSTKRGHAGEKS